MTPQLCKVLWCERPARARGLCMPCYRRERRHGNFPTRLYSSNDKTCKEYLCEADSYARGYCRPHYEHRFRRGTLPPVVVGVPRCSTEGCRNPMDYAGRCSACNMRVRRHGEESLTWRDCVIPGCDDAYELEGLCRPHFLIRREIERDTDDRKRSLLRLSIAPLRSCSGGRI